MSVELAGTIFFVAGLLSAISQLAAWLAQRIGLSGRWSTRTCRSEPVPDRAAFMPTRRWPWLLLLRTSLSQMDVPARQSYVMAMVPPEERAAAASVTNVPRSLASAGARPWRATC